MASRFNPYLNVDGNAARATEFYHCRLPTPTAGFRSRPARSDHRVARPCSPRSCGSVVCVLTTGILAPPQPQVRCDGRVSPHRVSRACR